MGKKWLISIGFALTIALLTLPLSGHNSQAKGTNKLMPSQVHLVSGGLFPGGEAADGIIEGGPCTPDIHDFDKAADEATVVFITGVQSDGSQDFAALAQENVDIYVEVTSNGQKVLEVPMMTSSNPEEPTFDWSNGNPLWIGSIHFNSAEENTDLPTGEYNYMFKAKAKGANGHVLDVWVPKNHKFTIVDTRN